MGFLVQILLAAGALSMAEAGLGSGGWPAELGILLLPLPHLVSLAARRAGEAGRFRRAARWIRLGSLLPPLAYAALVLQTDWLARVRSWTGAGLDLDGWPELALGLAFAPYVLYQLSGIHADARAHDPRPDIRKRVLRFQVRMFLSALMPLVLYLVLTVGVGLVPGWRAHVENVGLFHALFIAGLMVVLGLSHLHTQETIGSFSRQNMRKEGPRNGWACWEGLGTVLVCPRSASGVCSGDGRLTR